MCPMKWWDGLRRGQDGLRSAPWEDGMPCGEDRMVRERIERQEVVGEGDSDLEEEEGRKAR